jgi:sigma-B regulation protein RsbU (phosphoserine phosphatase)
MALEGTHPVAPSEAGRVLIADDQMHILEAIAILCRGSGLLTEAVTHPARVLPALQAGHFDAVLIDLNYMRDTTAGREGLELVSQIRSIDSLIPVVVMTAWSSVDLAVEAMRRGASDFIQKPWDNRELLEKLQTQVARARERRRIQRRQDEELEEARQIQDRLLPKELPELAGYEVAAMSRPLCFVGGDYYNVMRVSDRRTALVIADVAGKGLPAALLMSSLQAALTPLILQRLTPRELCRRLNRTMYDLTPSGRFVTLFYAMLDSVDHTLTYCNAGHNPPLLIRRDATCSELKTGGAVLGQFEDWAYEQRKLHMRSSDKLLLFTDGLVEVSNGQEEPFGENRLIRLTRENSHASAAELMALLIRSAAQHNGGNFQDDASLIVLRAARGATFDVEGGAS